MSGLLVLQLLLPAFIVASIVGLATLGAERFGGLMGAIISTTPFPNIVYSTVYILTLDPDAVVNSWWNVGFAYLSTCIAFFALKIAAEQSTIYSTHHKKRRVALFLLLWFVCWISVAVIFQIIRVRSSPSILPTLSVISFAVAFVIALIGAFVLPRKAPAAKAKTGRKILFLRMFCGFCMALLVVGISKLDPSIGGVLSGFPIIGFVSIGSLWFTSVEAQNDDLALGMVGPLLVGNVGSVGYYLLAAVSFKTFKPVGTIFFAFFTSVAVLIFLFYFVKRKQAQMNAPPIELKDRDENELTPLDDIESPTKKGHDELPMMQVESGSSIMLEEPKCEESN